MHDEPQSVLQKEIRLMRLQYKGLSYYTQPQSQLMFEPCETIPKGFRNCSLPRNSMVFRTSNTPRNRVVLMIVSLLKIAYEEPGLVLLRRIKQVAYDQDIALSAFKQKDQYDVEDSAMRKLFVEFFHLTACDRRPDKVTRSLEKHLIAQEGLVALLKAVLSALGLSADNQSSLRQIVQPICKFFKMPFIEEEENIFKFSHDHFVMEDSNSLYISSQPSASPSVDQLLSSISSSEEVKQKAANQKSIIEQLELSAVRSRLRVPSNIENECALVQTQQKAVCPLSRRFTHADTYDVTPERTKGPLRSVSPVSINKPVSSRTITTGTSKSPLPLTKNRTMVENFSPFNRPCNNNYSFGIKKESKVTIAPLKQIVGGPLHRAPLEVMPSLSFKNLLNRRI